MLYSVIVSWIKNRPLRLIMEPVSRDGRGALRKLDAECRPTYRGRQLALLKRVMHPHLNSAGSDAEYIDKLSAWQQVMREHERISGKELEKTVKTATLVEEAPPQLREHLRGGSEDIGTDHKEVILAIEGYDALEENLGFLEGPVDMDTGAVHKGKGQPKGKGKIKGKGKSDRDKGKGKSHEPKHNENSNKSHRKCFVCGRTQNSNDQRKCGNGVKRDVD